MAAAAAAFRASSEPPTAPVLARPIRGGRGLDVLCIGASDVVTLLAPVASSAGAELVVAYAASAQDPAVRDTVGRGAVLLAGTLEVRPTRAALRIP